MKLCRFELLSSPGQARSGIVHGSKVYETDGTNPVGVYEWSECMLLAPIGQPRSVRFFPASSDDLNWETGPDTPPGPFSYINPASLLNPGQTLVKPIYSAGLQCQPCLAVVIGGVGKDVPVSEGDGLILGLCLGCSFQTSGDSGGRALDPGLALGPAITTPDELDDSVTEDERGRRYRFSISLLLNGTEVGSFDLTALPHTLSEFISYASESCSVEQSDILLAALPSVQAKVEQGDQIHVRSENLGALGIRIV